MKAAYSLAGVAVAVGAALGACNDATSSTTPDGSAPPAYDAGVEAGPVTCGSATCDPADFRGVATLPACCAADGACGLDLSPAASFVPTPSGCTSLTNPGVSDETCPTYPSPSSLYPGDLQGCCRADHTCGVFVKLSSSIDLGCVAAQGFADEAGAPAPCGLDAGDDAATDASDDAASDAGDGGSQDAGSLDAGDAGD